MCQVEQISRKKKDKVRAQRKRHYNTNKQYYIERAMQWRSNNPDKFKEINRQCRIRNWAKRQRSKDNWRRYEERALMRDWEIAKAWMETHPEAMAKCPL